MSSPDLTAATSVGWLLMAGYTSDRSFASLSRLGPTLTHPTRVPRSIDQCLIDERIHHLPILPADRSRRVRHPHHDQLLARVHPPVGAACARPGEIADRAHHSHDPWSGANRNPEPETVVAAGRVARGRQQA